MSTQKPDSSHYFSVVQYALDVHEALGSTRRAAQLALRRIEEQVQSLERIETAARDFLTACDENDELHISSLDAYCTLVEAVSGLPDTREADERSLREQQETLREALDDPDLLHWLGSSDVLDVSPALARAVAAIHAIRAALYPAKRLTAEAPASEAEGRG